MEKDFQVEFRQAFLDELLVTETYVGRHNHRLGRQFTQAVFDFAYSVVGPMPMAFPAYQHPKLPFLALRRAVFRRTYALLYEVIDDAVVFVYFYHTRCDISQKELT